jgi:hypothetical protein
LEVTDFILPGLPRDCVIGGGERPTDVKFKFSLSEAVVEADRRENVLLLVDRWSGEFVMLASSLATSAADNMGCGEYSDGDRAEMLDSGDPASSQNDDWGLVFRDAQGFNGTGREL